MSKTRIISPGSIPNHKLLKNLQLQGNYISNDGGDEGIRITDAGLVGIGVNDPDTALEIMVDGSPQLKLSKDASDYLTFEGGTTAEITATRGIDINLGSGDDLRIFESTTQRFLFGNSGTHTEFKMRSVASTSDFLHIEVQAEGATVITTTDNDTAVAHLTLAPDGDCIIDRDTALTATATAKGLHIDYDHTGISASGQTVTGIGLDLDMNCESVSHVGTVNQTGIDLDMVAATAGTQNQTGLGITVSGGDISNGIYIDTDGTVSNGLTIDNKNGAGNDFKNASSADITDYFTINTIAAGATTLTTVDTTVGATAHLTLDPDGDLIFSGCDVHIDSGKALVLDGSGGHTAIYEHADDHVRYVVGDDPMMTMTEAGNDGNVIDFGTSGVGFLQHEPTYNATDTYVFFSRLGNKAHLTFTSASETIVDVHLYFPNVSCNCILLIKQHASGGGAVTNWKTWDQAGGNESTVVWAGGSAPTLTTGGSKIDIVSFYWDNDNHKAYGVASLDF